MYVVFADLGKSRDFAVQGIIQHTIEGNDPTRAVDRFVLRYIKRFPLQTSYRDQVAHFKKLLEWPDMRGEVEGVYDATGVGKAVAEEFERQHVRDTWGITISSGHQVGINAEGWTVPKIDLITGLLIDAEYGRFITAQGLPEDALRQLEKEMIDLKVKPNHKTRHVGIEAGNEETHDDMVLGICLGLWWLKQRVNLIEQEEIRQEVQEPYDELRYGMK